jgi:hypothetical protein
MKTDNKTPKTALELSLACAAQRALNPEVIAKETERLERAKQLEEAAADLLAELRLAGVNLRSIGSEINSDAERKIAIPILIKHLKLSYPLPILQSIAMKLATPYAIEIRNDIIQMFRNPPVSNFNFQYDLGSIIARTTTTSNIQDTVTLLTDSTLGPSRLALLAGVKKFKRRPEIKELLVSLSRDPDLSVEIASWKLDKEPMGSG